MNTREPARPLLRRRGARGLALLLGSGLAVSSLVLVGGVVPAAAATAKGKVMAAANRAASAPDVMYPLAKAAHPRDLQTYRKRKHPGTEILAPCGSAVRAIQPGTVHISSSRTSGPNLVSVISSSGRLTTYYGFMRAVTVAEGQIVSSGQQVGVVGNLGVAKACSLHVQVRTNFAKTVYNPSTWLDGHVGKSSPDQKVFGNYGFLVASFNMLGASHTKRPGGDANKRYPTYDLRTPKAVAYLASRGIEVAGLQEFQKQQYALFMQQSAGRYGIWPQSAEVDTENSIIWRTDRFDLVSGGTFAIPYFNGNPRNMNYVLLRQRSTGRTAYFLNVHNPANTYQYHNQNGYRAQAIAIERALVVQLRATGRPVILTGDFNDRAAAFCPLTAGKLMLSANSVPSTTCQPPASLWIDWIFAAGGVRFGSYVRDFGTRDQEITDHPIVYARAFLAE